MAPVVAVIAAGAMGAAVGKRLTDHGVTVLTSLAGRSEATAARAAAAVVARFGTGQFVAELSLLTGQATYLSPGLQARTGPPDITGLFPAGDG